jgi:hypothetical protein
MRAFYVPGIMRSGTTVLQPLAERMSDQGGSSAGERRLASISVHGHIVIKDMWKPCGAHLFPLLV